jgi:D-psicose/D-tagatose/L-ribulose 3-epimerase
MGAGEQAMRFGASTWAFTFPYRSPRDDALVDRMASLGCDHFEIGGESMMDPGAIDTIALRRRLSDAGMSASVCGIFTPQLDLSSLEAGIRRAGLDYLGRCVDVAHAIGASVVVGAFCGVGGTHVPSEAERTARVGRAAETLHEAGAHAADAGVRLGIEALNRYENNLINTIAQSERIVDLAGHPNVGFHLDLFHANIEESDLGAAIRLAGPRLVHCHAVDTNRAAPGSAHMPWPGIVGALRDIGYESALVIETFDPENAAIAALASFWRRFSPTQDDLVRDGVAYLRSVTRSA